MKLNGIKYERTFNLGSYESEKIGVDASIDDGDDARKVLAELKKFVTEGQKGSQPDPQQLELKPIVEKSPEEQAPVEEKKAKKEKAQAKETEEKPATEKKEKKFKTATTKYDRSNELHKKLFSELLDVQHPGWRKSASRAADASRKMEGEDFLDSEGMKLKPFIEKVAQLLA